MIFLIGTFWFWTLIFVTAVVIIYFLEASLEGEDDLEGGGGVPATVTLLISLAVFSYWGGKQTLVDLLTYLRHNPLITVSLIVSYFISGTIWSFFKWYFFLKKVKNKMIKESKSIKKDKIPNISKNKSKIMTWMMYWPFSMLWTMIDEPIKNTFKFIFGKVENVYQKMANRIFNDAL